MNKPNKIKRVIDKDMYLQIQSDINLLVLDLLKYPPEEKDINRIINIYSGMSTLIVQTVLGNNISKEETRAAHFDALRRKGYTEEELNKMANNLDKEERIESEIDGHIQSETDRLRGK